MPDVQLSSLERFVANGLLQGMRPLEIAGRMGLQRWTIRDACIRLRLKLSANSLQDVVAMIGADEVVRAQVLSQPLVRAREQTPEAKAFVSSLKARTWTPDDA